MRKRVTPSEAAVLVQEGWIYLDVRSVPEFEQGHPAGAANVPLLHFREGRMAPNPDFQRVVEANFSKEAKLVIGCKSGGRSLQAAALLEVAGYRAIVDVRGGFGGEMDAMGRPVVAGWAASGLPVENRPRAGRSYPELAEKAAPTPR